MSVKTALVFVFLIFVLGLGILLREGAGFGVFILLALGTIVSTLCIAARDD